jgi:hypothetical protein
MRLLLLLCILPCFASAQSWHARIETGALWNTQTTKPAKNERSSPLNVLLAAGASRQMGIWEAGATIGIYRYAFRIKGEFDFKPNPVTGASGVRQINFVDRAPALSIKAFLNKYLDTAGKQKLYIGIAPSVSTFFAREVNRDIRGDSKVVKDAIGYGLEVYGGSNYQVSDGVSFLVEPAIGFINLPVYYGRAFMFTARLSLAIRLNVK